MSYEVVFSLLALMFCVAVLYAAFRWWPAFDVAERKCDTCEHFNYALGQQEAQKHPAFIQAAQHVPLSAMSHRLDENGDVIEEPEEPSPEALLTTVDDLGLCTADRVLCSRADSCPKWKARA